MAEINYIEVPCRLLAYEERDYKGKKYSDITVRVGTRVVKLTVEPSGKWDGSVDSDVVVLCEVSSIYGTLTNTLKGVTIKE